MTWSSAAGKLPDIHNALIIKEKNVVCEVAQQIGDNTVRCVAMSSTEDIARGMDVEDTGSPIMVPVGDETLGRVFNVLGEAIDHGKPMKGGHQISYPQKVSRSSFAQAFYGDVRDRQ